MELNDGVVEFQNHSMLHLGWRCYGNGLAFQLNIGPFGVQDVMPHFLTTLRRFTTMTDQQMKYIKEREKKQWRTAPLYESISKAKALVEVLNSSSRLMFVFLQIKVKTSLSVRQKRQQVDAYCE